MAVKGAYFEGMAHFLAPPYGLPDALDSRLYAYLQDDDWASASTLLRDAVAPKNVNWKWLVLLAYVRFRDASEVLVDELTPAAREALGLLDRAMEQGAQLGEIAPLQDAVEAALDQLTREEEALSGQWERAPETLTADELERLAFIYRRDAPAKAASVFDALYAKRPSPGVKALSVLSLGANAGELEALLSENWEKPERLVLEEVETALLEKVSGAEFEIHWRWATEKGKALDFEFPTAWPNQERVFLRLWSLGEHRRAQVLGDRMKEERLELPAMLREKLDAPSPASG